MDIKTILDGCKGGEIIDLTGKEIDPFYIRNYKFDEPVRLMGGTYKAPNNQSRSFRLDACSGIRFEQAEVVGQDRSADGFLFHSCSNFAFRKCEMHGLKMGIAYHMCDDFTIELNTIRNLRVDAIRGGGASNARILANQAFDFFPINTGGTGDHPDMVQFWPLEGSTNDNITVSGNMFKRGEGLPIQGIFLRGIYRNSAGELVRPMFGNVSVTDNVIEGGLYNGVAVSGAKGEVKNNHVYMWDDQKSWLRISEFDGEVSGNTAPHFIGDVPEATNTLANIEPKKAEPAPRTIVLKAGEKIIISSE